MLKQELEKLMDLLIIVQRLELTIVQRDKFIDFICLLKQYEQEIIFQLSFCETYYP